jgi:hypothetical protein
MIKRNDSGKIVAGFVVTVSQAKCKCTNACDTAQSFAASAILFFIFKEAANDFRQKLYAMCSN